MKRYFIGDYIFDVEVLDVWNFENEEYEHIETIALEETGEVDFEFIKNFIKAQEKILLKDMESFWMMKLSLIKQLG